MRTNTVRTFTSEVYDQVVERAPANDNRPAPAPEPTIGAAELQLVRQLAGTLVRRLPSHITLDELVAQGNLGLVEARRRYDPSRGVPFAGFAAPRIRGAMIDALRHEDPVTRAERARLQRDVDATASVQLVDVERAADQTADDQADAEAQLCHSALLTEVRAALGMLRDRERFVLERHFFGEQSLRSIGEELGVTESRVCQLVGAALGRLRQSLKSAA